MSETFTAYITAQNETRLDIYSLQKLYLSLAFLQLYQNVGINSVIKFTTTKTVEDSDGQAFICRVFLSNPPTITYIAFSPDVVCIESTTNITKILTASSSDLPAEHKSTWQMSPLRERICSMVELTVVTATVEASLEYSMASFDDIQVAVGDCLRNVCFVTNSVVRSFRNSIGNLHKIRGLVVHWAKKMSDQEAEDITNDTGIYLRVDERTVFSIRRIISWSRLEGLNGGLNYRYCLNLGGHNRFRRQIREFIKNNQFGKHSYNSLLLSGPSGCGKTSIVFSICQKMSVLVFRINCGDIIEPYKSLNELKKKFIQAENLAREASTVFVLDNIDLLFPTVKKYSSKNCFYVCQIAQLIENYVAGPIIAITNSISKIDSILKRNGRLGKEIIMGIPRYSERLEILRPLLSHALGENDLKEIAKLTPGYLAADLACLVSHARQHVVSNRMFMPVPMLNHIRTALRVVVPSGLKCKSVYAYDPGSVWDQVGGLEMVKRQLQRSIEWPIKYPQAFFRLGIRRPNGLLLYGPPGCGKTSLVRAVASSAGVTFFSLNASAIYSPFVGDSEKTLSEIFKKAKTAAPSIIFIDEIESVVSKRGESTSSQSQERILSVLLNEMDGFETHHSERFNSDQQECQTSIFLDCAEVIVIGATNHPAMMDEALFRPGRFDKLIYVGSPSLSERLKLLREFTKHMPLGQDVNISEFAFKTTDLYSGADLQLLCCEAVLDAMNKSGFDVDFVSQQNFNTAFDKLKPSLTDQMLTSFSSLVNKTNNST